MPEIILPIVFLLSLFMLKLINKRWSYALSARIAMTAMLTATGIAHFVYTKGMAIMLPDFVPYRTEIIYATGMIEILAAAGILVPTYQKLTGWLLILFLILVLPANIYSAIKQVNMKTATFDGEGAAHLWYRIPLQLFFIGWIYFSCIKSRCINGTTRILQALS